MAVPFIELQSYVVLQLQTLFFSLSPVFWLTTTDMGVTAFLLPMLLVLLPVKSPRILGVVLLASLLVSVLVQSLKHWLQQPRPLSLLPITDSLLANIPRGDTGFPSGHSAAVFLFFGVLFYLMSDKKRLLFFVGVFAFLVAFSRVVIAAHWPLDVVVGSVIGFVVGYGCCYLLLPKSCLAGQEQNFYSVSFSWALIFACLGYELWFSSYALTVSILLILLFYSLAYGVHALFILPARFKFLLK